MTSDEQLIIDELDRRGREFRQAMRNLRAAQIRHARWCLRATPEEWAAYLKSQRPPGIGYWITEKSA